MEDNEIKTRTKQPASLMTAAVVALALSAAAQWYQVVKISTQKPSVADSVVVVDFLQMAMLHEPGASEAQIEQAMVTVRDTIRDLGNAGFIVIDSQAVISAPRDAYLHELLKPVQGE